MSILNKIRQFHGENEQALSETSSNSFSEIVGSARTFGFRTFFKGRKSKKPNDLMIHQNGGTAYVSREKVTTGQNFIDKWKIFIGYAASGTGNKDTYPHKIISTPFIGTPGTISSETYLPIGPFDSKVEALNAVRYLTCKLTRFLIQLRKSSQHVTRNAYTFVPLQDWNEEWSDEKLFKQYDINDEEKAFIDRIVRPMELDLFSQPATD